MVTLSKRDGSENTPTKGCWAVCGQAQGGLSLQGWGRLVTEGRVKKYPP